MLVGEKNFKNRSRNTRKPNDNVTRQANFTTGRLTTDMYLVRCASVAV